MLNVSFRTYFLYSLLCLKKSAKSPVHHLLLECARLTCEAGSESNRAVSKISKGVVACMAQMAFSET